MISTTPVPGSAQAVPGFPVSLAEVLHARDARAERQATLLSGHSRPVVSLTLVSPGPVKDSPSRRALMDRAVAMLLTVLSDRNLAVHELDRADGPTGPEAMLSVDCDPLELKRIACRLETGEWWGRLLDVDVICRTERVKGRRAVPVPLSREEVGADIRPCLLCSRPAVECIGSGSHERTELARAAEAMYERFAGEAR